jgi:AcrR family transcriptional regulator
VICSENLYRSEALRKGYRVGVTSTDPVRKRGRQAEAARNDRLLLDAAREVFTTQGFDAPVSAVAERAGVGIGSLYRRYGTKEELLQRLCLLAMEQGIDAAHTALRTEEPWAGLEQYIRQCVAFRSGAFAPIAGSIDTTPEMWQASKRGRALVDALVTRAHSAGVLRSDVTTLDILLLIEQFSRGGPTPPTDEDDNTRQRLLAIAFDGLHARNAGPLPRRPPSAQRYEARWRKS